MNKKMINLIAGILALIVFVGYLGEPGPVHFFGLAINIWIVRFIWLFMSLTFFANYSKTDEI